LTTGPQEHEALLMATTVLAACLNAHGLVVPHRDCRRALQKSLV